MKADLPQITEGRLDDWVATCGVCEGNFAVRAADVPENPAPHGSFCPDCRAKKLMAPGVLYWQRRAERIDEVIS